MSEKVAEAPSLGKGGRKQVTAVFVDVVGFSELAQRLDAEDLQNWLTEFYEQTRAIVETYDGEVTEYLGDGIVALFGLSRSDELAASKAVHASLTALDKVDAGPDRDIKIKLRIGIATGEVAVRALSDNQDMPRATGIVTTLAQRIQEKAAPGTVMIAQGTQELLRGMFKTKETPLQTLKGFTQTQSLFQPFRQTAVSYDTGPVVFVSRKPELERITQSKLPCLVMGPAGIGKTALLQQFAKQPNPIAQFTADGTQTHSIYLPFVSWLTQTLGSNRPAFRHLELHFPKLTDEAKHGLALMLGLPEGQRLLSELSNVAVKRLIEESIWNAIQSKHASGLIIFEDLHWLDSASFGVLGHILRSDSAAQYQILLSSRDDPKIDKYLDQIPLTKVPLRPLSDTDAAEMLAALSSNDDVKDVHTQLVARAAGVPLFIAQLLKRAESSYGADHGLPETLADLLADQIDATGPAKPILQCAAIVGQSFERDFLDTIAGSDLQIDIHLAQACKDGVLRKTGPDSWSFAHSLLHQAAYQGMLLQTRSAYHSKVAAYLQNSHADEALQNPWLLAEHLRRAQQHIPAIENYLRASQLALFQGAFEDAEAHVLAALTLCANAPANVDTRALEIASQTALGSIRMQTLGFTADPVKAAFDQVTQLARGQNEFSIAHGPAFCGSFTNAILSGDKENATLFASLLKEAANFVDPESSNNELRLASLNVDASLHFYGGDFAQTFKNTDRLREIYDISKHGAMIVNYAVDAFAATQMFEAAARAIAGDTHLIPGLNAETDAHQKLLNIPIMLPYAQIWGAVPLFYAGQTKQAVARVLDGLQMAEAQSAAFWQVTGAAWLNVMDPSQSDTAEGLAGFESVIGTHEVIGAHVGLPYFRANYALALAKHDQLDAAYDASLKAVRENTQNGLMCWYAEVLRIHANICQMTKRRDDAKRYLEHAVETAKVQNARLWLLRARLDQASLGLIDDKELSKVINAFHPDAKPPEITVAQNWLASA